MTFSMTGFARSEVSTELGSITLELRAVNHRYLETNMRIPEELRRYEIKLREKLQKGLSRGKVDCNVRLRMDAGKASAVVVNEEFTKGLLATVKQVEDWMHNPARLSSIDVMKWPGVVQEEQPDMDILGKGLTSALDEALKALVEMRASEGGRMAEVITTRLNQITEIVKLVRTRRPEVLRLQREKIQNKLAEIDITADDSRLEQELVMMASKLDVDEELDRLESHITAVNEALAKKDPVGRRLDFLMQEFNREANTLGSKSSDAETTQAAVELKVLIEQMREQVQNIE